MGDAEQRSEDERKEEQVDSDFGWVHSVEVGAMDCQSELEGMGGCRAEAMKERRTRASTRARFGLLLLAQLALSFLNAVLHRARTAGESHQSEVSFHATSPHLKKTSTTRARTTGMSQ